MGSTLISKILQTSGERNDDRSLPEENGRQDDSREGQSCSVTFVDNTETYDPSTGTNSAATAVTVSSKVVLLDFALESLGTRTYNGTLIETGDKEFYLTKQTSFPRDPNPSSDYLTDASGVKWLFKIVKNNNPTGTDEVMLQGLVRR